MAATPLGSENAITAESDTPHRAKKPDLLLAAGIGSRCTAPSREFPTRSIDAKKCAGLNTSRVAFSVETW